MVKEIKCYYCGEKAEYETDVSDVYLCDDDNCWLEHAREQDCRGELTEKDHLEYGEDDGEDEE